MEKRRNTRTVCGLMDSCSWFKNVFLRICTLHNIGLNFKIAKYDKKKPSFVSSCLGRVSKTTLPFSFVSLAQFPLWEKKKRFSVGIGLHWRKSSSYLRTRPPTNVYSAREMADIFWLLSRAIKPRMTKPLPRTYYVPSGKIVESSGGSILMLSFRKCLNLSVYQSS